MAFNEAVLLIASGEISHMMSDADTMVFPTAPAMMMA